MFSNINIRQYKFLYINTISQAVLINNNKNNNFTKIRSKTVILMFKVCKNVIKPFTSGIDTESVNV